MDADSTRKVRRLFWIQFEGYLPHVDARYDGYTSPDRVQIGGREFIVDRFAYPSNAPSRPGSDRERAKALLTRQGFHFPADMMMRRMVTRAGSGVRHPPGRGAAVTKTVV